MKLKATIVIDIDADDFVDAADHQRRIEAAVAKIHERYPRAWLDFREQRGRAAAAEDRSRRQPAALSVTPAGLRPYLD